MLSRPALGPASASSLACDCFARLFAELLRASPAAVQSAEPAERDSSGILATVRLLGWQVA